MRVREKLRIAVFASLLVSSGACAASDPQSSANEQAPSATQARSDLYLCEGCEAVHERDAAGLAWRTTMAPEGEPGEPLVLRGTVYRQDGVTPAPGVVIYAHQTNAEGAYAGGTNESEWSRRHGRVRAWVKTGPDGKYEFVTVKPAPYPTHSEPAHIHLTVLEPGRQPYYVDDVVFAGEYRVDDEYRRTRENRGGSGIVQLERTGDGTWVANRDIRLEAHPES